MSLKLFHFHFQTSYKALSWSAFHSKLSTSPPVLSNVGIVAPLYRRSPTQVPVLIDLLKRAMNITVITIGPGIRTCITLDGDLYKNAVKIPNYKDKWIIRLGSLHTIIAALKCLGKYIEGSGIDTAWEMCGIYGSVTVNQILEGRHIYRGIQAHTVTLLALHSLYGQSILTSEDQKTIQALTSAIYDTSQEKNDFKISIQNVKEKLIDSNVFEKLNMSASSANATGVFLCIYMRQVMNLLNYIGATRLRDWMQHLATTNEMCKYFHAHDQSNYKTWALLYLADMMELRTEDPETWKFFDDGNFTVSKNEVPFTSIDPDHAIEHEHRPMKMKGGFVNITGNESALERFVLTSPILSRISEDYQRFVLYTYIMSRIILFVHKLA